MFKFFRQWLKNAIYISLVNFRYSLKFLKVRAHTLDKKIVISLTSYPPRFSTLHLTIKTLLSQNISANAVVLWIYEEDLSKLPSSIKKMESDLFKIKTTVQDTKSFKKLLPALRLYPDAYIVTADDDVYYPSNWLRELVGGYNPDKKEVIGHRAHEIKVDIGNNLLPYNDWSWAIKCNKANEKVFLTGVGGIFYPPGSLNNEVFNDAEFLKLCPSADDIWFYFMLRKNNFICKKIGGKFEAYSWIGSQEVALGRKNVDENMNDKAINKMLKKYGMPF